MAAYGIVSRVTPVHTAVRNCTRDEGRSFEVDNQVSIRRAGCGGMSRPFYVHGGTA